ncbi:MAG: AAA family ATPase [Pseudonocardiales bacterium]|nr:AAA family ATPase [Pseudonocardiales bacterium]
MIDPRCEAVLIADRKTGQFADRTRDVASYQAQTVSGKIDIVFNGDPRVFSHGWARVRILRNPARVSLPLGARVEVRGVIWEYATELWAFTGPVGEWWRIFSRRQEGEEVYYTYPASEVRVVTSAVQAPAAAEVLRYWQDVASRLPGDDPLRRAYARLNFVHPDSVLGCYLAGAPIASRERTAAPIFPFRCNISQRKAIDLGLTRSVSVIEGPPGTGKTETILNLIANIITAQAGTVGVVSFTNAAVENIRDKLDDLGFGHVIANLGRKEKREEFFAKQATRNARVRSFADDVPSAPPPPELMDKLDRRLRRLQEAELTRAELRGLVDAYRLELQHFERHLQRHEAPDLEGLPLLRRSSDRILDYLAETEVEHNGARPGLLRRIRKYFRYGSLRGLDPDDTNVVLRLQRAYYDKRIAELEGELDQVQDELRRADFNWLLEEHRELSIQALRAALGTRYKPLERTTYTAENYTLGTTFTGFTWDYPVLLSTCHSLPASIANGYLLDYLIIDEASQVNLLAAGLALSCCRNVVVVGDLRQLPPIANDAAAGVVPPKPAYDYREHSILSSLIDLYPDDLPRTLLREHYRCDPAIIGFCNKAFYDGELIPFTTSDTNRPMIVVRTVEGNHMRQHRGGGRSNQREVDVIVKEVIPAHCADVLSTDIGITTPYRRQVDKVVDALIDQIEADTVHKFQGRQKQVVILTTVLDEGWRGRTGLTFVDDPQKINVAVSRAVRRFILVINHAMLPTSRYIRDLIGYICYHHPDEEVVDSAVISMFDLLYSDYNQRLRPLAARLKNEMKYKSEDIIWTALQDILAEDRYAHLTVSYQVLLRNLLVDLSRLTPRHEAFVRHRASVDFVVYNRVTNYPLLAIEVDGFAFHENNPDQLKRDTLKNEIFQIYQMPLLRLATTGSG